MKSPRFKWLLFPLGFLVGAGLTYAVYTHAQTKPITYNQPTQNVITQSSQNQSIQPAIQKSNSVRYTSKISGTPIRNSGGISVETIRQYLQQKNSPLAEYADQIAASDYSGTIVGICTIEEYSCSVNPYGSNNFWGLMAGGKIIRFPTIADGIQGIITFLSKANASGRTTIESFRGWYCASECTNWESTVLKTKHLLENQ